MRRTKEEALRTKERLMDAALDVFSNKDFSSASISDIAEEAGVTKGALYWHFKNKSDLLLKLVEELCKESEERVRNIMSASDSQEKIKNYYNKYLAMLRSDTRVEKIHRVMVKHDELPPDVRERVKDLITESLAREKEMIASVVKAGQECGRIRRDISADTAADLVSTVFRGLSLMLLSGLLPENFEKCTDFLFNALAHELALTDV